MFVKVLIYIKLTNSNEDINKLKLYDHFSIYFFIFRPLTTKNVFDFFCNRINWQYLINCQLVKVTKNI